MNDDENIKGEQIEYICAHCGSKTWTLSVLLDYEENQTLLLVQCSNDQCLKTREVMMQGSEEDPIGWDVFNITGQGYDKEDFEEDEVPTDNLVN